MEIFGLFNVELENKVRILDKLTELGVFTRILLQELKDYGLVFYPRLPDSKCFKEPNEFFETLQKLASKQHQIDIKTDYIGKYIKVSMVMVGRPETVFKLEGIDNQYVYSQSINFMHHFMIKKCTL